MIVFYSIRPNPLGWLSRGGAGSPLVFGKGTPGLSGPQFMALETNSLDPIKYYTGQSYYRVGPVDFNRPRIGII